MSLDAALGGLHEPLTGRHQDATACRRQIRSGAAWLAARGLRPGDRVFLHAGNDIDFLLRLLSIWAAGGCAVPVDPRLTAFEAEALGRAARPTLSLWAQPPGAALADALRQLGVEVLGWELPDAGGAAIAGPIKPHASDDALILFTSGTTGRPKGVVHTHGSLQRRWMRQNDILGTTAIRRTLFMLPGNFAWGLAGNALQVWLAGGDLFILPAFRTDVLLRLGELCDEHRITYLPTVPSMWRVALRTVAPPQRRTIERVACGTSPLPARLWQDVQAWSGAGEVLNVYSMTECGMLATHSTRAGPPEDGLVGAPFAGVELRIVPLGEPHHAVLAAAECARGVAGVVWARTDTLMRGYYGRDDLTDEVVCDGWFRTGDVGELDARGRLYLRGRDKEMINVGGVKVYPSDVDLVMERCEAVRDVCTFGIEDAMQGEQVAVAIVLKPPREHSLGQLQRWAEEHLAPFQMPRRWYFVDEIARTARGKLNREQVATMCRTMPATDARGLAAAGRKTSG